MPPSISSTIMTAINASGTQGAKKNPPKKFFRENASACLIDGFSSRANSMAAMRQIAPPKRDQINSEPMDNSRKKTMW